MAIENYKIIKKMVPRPWGKECRFNAIHIKTGKVYNEVIVCSDLKKEVVNNLIDIWLQKQEDAESEEVRTEEIYYSESEIAEILRYKGYLEADQSLDDLPFFSNLKAVIS